MKAILTLAALSSLLVSCASTSGGIKPYPSDTCLVTENKLGSMGTPVTRVHAGHEVKFCCKPCVAKFESNPGKYLAKIQ